MGKAEDAGNEPPQKCGKFMKEPHTEVTALCQEESCP